VLSDEKGIGSDVSKRTGSKSIRILLIEGSSIDAELFRRALSGREEQRFELTHVDQLEVGIDWLRTREFELAVVDLSLPGRDGLESPERILRAIEDPPPILVMAGLDDEELAVKAVQAGAEDYPVKGQLEPRSLSHAMQSAIERRRLMSELQDAKQRDFLLERNCNTMQGFLFSPPVEADTFRKILARGRIDVEKGQPG